MSFISSDEQAWWIQGQVRRIINELFSSPLSVEQVEAKLVAFGEHAFAKGRKAERAVVLACLAEMRHEEDQ